MKRVSLLLRLALAVPVILLLNTGLLANDQPKGSTSAAKTTTSKSQTAKSTSHGTSSGSTKAVANPYAKMPPAPSVADEARSYRMTQAEPTEILGEYNGSVLDLPQMPAREMPELELLEPAAIQRRVLMSEPTTNAPTTSPSAPAPAPIMNFDGMSYLDNYCVGGQCGAGHPPDTTGAVGLNHYIEGINMAYAIYDKVTGNRLAAFTENSLWANVANGGNCTSSPFGDPIVVYDQTADRWILTNFAFIVNSNGTTSGPYMQCFAVSKSGDPVNGGWWFYAVRVDQGSVPVNTLNDYPKFGVWNDGCLYMTANGFLNGSTFSGAIVGSLSLTDMYNGLPLHFSLGFLSGSANYATVPAQMLGKGSSLPSPTAQTFLVTESATAYAFNVRTVTPAACTTSATISAATVVPQASYGSVGQNIIPQPPPATSSNTLDSLGDRVMQWVQWRKVGGAESLWVQHTARTGTQNTVIQWAQLNVTGGTIAATALQQQLYRPDTTLYRWMGSIGADNAGNVAIGYSTSSATSPNFPSVRYSGRLASDSPNTLPQTETVLVAGQGSGVFNCGGAACHRWGDYGSMTVDPTDDCTFWYTNMYYNSQVNGSAGNHQTRISSFKYPSCTPVLPVVAITKSHSGNFTQGEIDATYTLTVTNQGPGYTFGTATVTDALPAGLTATAISGTGWTCTLGNLTCTSTDNIPAGSSYPSITVTVNVSNNAPAQVTNSATVSGGGAANSNTANDSTTIIQLTPTLAITKTHSGNFTQGQAGATYTITVSNSGTGATSGTVTVTDTLPSPYLVATAIGGSGWSCTPGTLTCTRTDSLAASSSYPAITLIAKVASNAPAQVTNSATASGGGAANSPTANDPTNINAAQSVCGTVQLTTTANLVKLGNGSYQATLLVVNNGTGTAQNVTLTAATLGVPGGSPVPQTIGSLVPGGGFAYTTVTFPSSAGTSGASVVEKYTGTYTDCPTSGSFGASIRATLP